LANDDAARLETLLGYWIEHNREHAPEFREWANKVSVFGEVGEDLRLAAAEMDKAGDCLSRALAKLGGREA